MIVQRDTRDGLEKYFDLTRPLTVALQIEGAATYDFCCFGVDAQGKLSDDRYMIYHNQLTSPGGEIIGAAIQSGMEFAVNLNHLPPEIDKLVFTIAVDGAGTMSDISRHRILIGDQIAAEFVGSDFGRETALNSLEIYRKDGWKFNVAARGFAGGLDELLAFIGGESVPTQKISLEEKIQGNAPKLISLVKPLKVELEKRNLLGVTARVALVVDISGSMNKSYKDGTVQEIVNKILPLAVQFDDDGELDFWFYGTTCSRRPHVNMSNYEGAIPDDWKTLRTSLGGVNNEPAVMEEVIAEYSESPVPAYVVFITDGGISKTAQIKRLLIESSYQPIFWQFVGVRGKDYGILEKFDTLKDRCVDNANFFALDDFRSVPDAELYSRLLNEFPAWLTAIEDNGVLDGSIRQPAQPVEESLGLRVKRFLNL